MVVVRATMWWVRNGKLRAREGGGDSGVVAMLVALVAVVGGDARARARIAGALTATSCACRRQATWPKEQVSWTLSDSAVVAWRELTWTAGRRRERRDRGQHGERHGG